VRTRFFRRLTPGSASSSRLTPASTLCLFISAAGRRPQATLRRHRNAAARPRALSGKDSGMPGQYIGGGERVQLQANLALGIDTLYWGGLHHHQGRQTETEIRRRRPTAYPTPSPPPPCKTHTP
jgi:hypothetical protein